MAKPQVLRYGKYDPRRVVYSQDHRHWGDDLYYWDIDGVEWGKHQQGLAPVALVEEHPIGSEADRKHEHRRYAELADVLSRGYGRQVWPFDVGWEADESKPEGQRILRVEVMQIGGDWKASMSRTSGSSR